MWTLKGWHAEDSAHPGLECIHWILDKPRTKETPRSICFAFESVMEALRAPQARSKASRMLFFFVTYLTPSPDASRNLQRCLLGCSMADRKPALAAAVKSSPWGTWCVCRTKGAWGKGPSLRPQANLKCAPLRMNRIKHAPERQKSCEHAPERPKAE